MPRRPRPAILALLAVLLLLCVAPTGCTTTGKPASPTITLAQAADTLASAENVLASAMRAGLIPPDVAPKVKASILAARDAEQAAVAHQGEPASANLLAEFQAALARVQQYQAAYAPAPKGGT